MNLKAISRNVGMALLFSALFMMLSVGVSLFYGKDSGFGPLLISSLVTFITGLFPFIFVRQTQPVSLEDGFVIIVLSWLLSFVFGMLPYLMWGGEFSLENAWFESVSGFTTTGATILKDIEALPNSLLFWRSSTHFIGGLGVVVFMLLIVPSASPFRARLTRIEMSSLSKEGFSIQSSTMVKVITLVYLSIFVGATLLLVLAGMPLFDAINHGFSVCATGGFSTKNASISYYDSTAINIVLLFFMLVATTNFILLFTCVARRTIRPLFRSRVVQYYFASVILMSAVVILSLIYQGKENDVLKAVLDGFCTVVSYVTTTGFGFADNRGWPFLAGVVLMMASIQCATAGSTSSGIKTDRMVIVFSSIGRQIRSTLNPNKMERVKLGDQFVPDSKILPILLYIVLYFLLILLSSGILLMLGVDGVEALSGSVSCMGNVGPGLGEISMAGNYSSMPAAAKLIFTLDMFLGRVEIYPILIAVSLIFKRNR